MRAFASSITAEAAKNIQAAISLLCWHPSLQGKATSSQGSCPATHRGPGHLAAPDGCFFIICAGLASSTYSAIFWGYSIACAWISQGSITSKAGCKPWCLPRLLQWVGVSFFPKFQLWEADDGIKP